MNDYKRFFNNIKIHVEMLVDDRMRTHAYASTTHDLDFQIFRIITGYDEALDKIDQLEKDKQELIDKIKDWENRLDLLSYDINLQISAQEEMKEYLKKKGIA